MAGDRSYHPLNWWLPDWISRREQSTADRRAGLMETPEAERDPLAGPNAYWTPSDERHYQAGETEATQAGDAVGSLMTAPVSFVPWAAKGFVEGLKDIPDYVNESLTRVPETDAELARSGVRALGAVGTVSVIPAALTRPGAVALAANPRRAAVPGAFARAADNTPPAAIGHNRPPAEVTGSKDLFSDTPATVDGRGPADWGPDDFQAYGERFGVTEGFGGTSGTSPIQGLDGTTYDIPNSFLRGEKGTYYDQLRLKAAAVNPRNLPPELHSKIHEGLLKTVTPDAADIGPERLFNQQLFGITSPNQALTPNAFAFGRLMAKSADDISKIAEMTPWSVDDIFAVKGGPQSQRAAVSRDITGQAGLNAAERGGLGASGSADYTRVSDLAKLVDKEPDFFRFAGDPSSPWDWEAHVGKIASQVPGLSYKTGSLGSVFENPLQAQISAIDRHMVRSYKKRGGTDLFETPKQERLFEKNVVKLVNKRREEAARARAKETKTRYRKPEKVTRYEDVGQGIVGEQLLQHLNSHKSPKYRLATGDLNPNVPDFYNNARFPVEPPSVAGMSDPYRAVLNANALDAAERPFGVFGEQWRHWDTLRQRLEPHEWMNPVLEKVGRMNLDQLKLSDAAHNAAGLKAAEGVARPTQSPGALAIFSNSPRAAVPAIATNALEKSSKNANIYRYPDEPQRPFKLDYPHDSGPTGAPLETTIDGVPLRSEFVAGRQAWGGGDVGLGPNQIDLLAKNLSDYVGPALEGQIGTDAGRYIRMARQDGPKTSILYRSDLSGESRPRVVAHEIGHALNDKARIPLEGIIRRLRSNYNTGANPNRGRVPGKDLGDAAAWAKKEGPEHHGYTKTADINDELLAEAFRAYLENPNYIKTRYPEIAARLREFANEHPLIAPHVQLNANNARAALPSIVANSRFMQASETAPGGSGHNDYGPLWGKEPFSSAVTSKLLDDVGRASLSTQKILDRYNYNSRQNAALQNILDSAVAKRYGLKTRADVMLMRDIFSKDGFDGLRKALARGDALPSNADVAGIVSLFPGLSEHDEGREL